MEHLDTCENEPDDATSATQLPSPPSPSTPVQSPKGAMQSPPPLVIKRRPSSFKPHLSEPTFAQTVSYEFSPHKLQTLEEQFKALMRDSSVNEDKNLSLSCQKLTNRTLFDFREDQSTEDEELETELLFTYPEVVLEDVKGESEFGVGTIRERKRAVQDVTVDRKQKRIKGEREFIEKSTAANQVCTFLLQKR